MAMLVYAKRTTMDADAVCYEFGPEMHSHFEGRIRFAADNVDSWDVEGGTTRPDHAEAAAYAVRLKFLKTGEWPVGAVYAA